MAAGTGALSIPLAPSRVAIRRFVSSGVVGKEYVIKQRNLITRMARAGRSKNMI